VWDDKIISQTLRTLTNYTQPLPSRSIESALRGAIYDPYVRWITWEGILGWWKDEFKSWAACPSSSPFNLISPVIPSHPDTQVLFPDPERDPLVSALQATPLDPSFPVCPYDWARPMHDELHCVNKSLHGSSNTSYIWPPHLTEVAPGTPPHRYPAEELIDLNTNSYRGRLQDGKIFEKLLARGGVRLAAILNEVLDPNGSEGVRVYWA
jgi:hypothetical protein